MIVKIITESLQNCTIAEIRRYEYTLKELFDWKKSMIRVYIIKYVQQF